MTKEFKIIIQYPEEVECLTADEIAEALEHNLYGYGYIVEEIK